MNQYPGGHYVGVIESMSRPILKHLPPQLSQLSTTLMPEALNVWFFTEQIPIVGTTIFMSHGIADKNWRNFEAVSHFDFVCVSGPLWARKMIRVGFPAERLLVIGYPKLDPLFQGEITRQVSSKTIVLWAPTYTKIQSIELLYNELIQRLPTEQYEIHVAPHPANTSHHAPTIQALADADVVISDCGSMIYEAWALGKPVVFPDWIIRDTVSACFPQSFEEYIYQQQIGYHAEHVDHLVEMIAHAAKTGIDDAAKEFIDQILPPHLRGTSGLEAARYFLKLSHSFS